MPTTATIIGGGPAGLIAAETLATAGWAVTVYEHMPSVGRKLLLAGRSGLNLTHHEPLATLLQHYGDAAVVRDAVVAFDPAALRAWADGLGESTFVGSSGRVFPHSMRATPLLRAWLARLAGLGVRIEVRHRWLGWADTGACRFAQADGTVVDRAADATVFALGGASWPRVGSDGGWVQPFREAGVVVHDLRPANCGVHIAWSTTFRDRFPGTPLKNIALTALGTTVRGDAVVTSTGLESGPVYPVSAAVRDEVARHGACTIAVDLQPDLTEAAISQRLSHRRPKESLTTWLRRTLALPTVAEGLVREATGNRPPIAPAALAHLLKAVPLTVHAVAPIDRAISSAGGIALAEIDERFMLRRLPGTFVAGEMLDWEAPTGGYLLQATFATGVAAAQGAIALQRGAAAGK
ncbi:MAG: TIGR03862 family flavoprotein [Actinomycetota bacterium]|nr:TIGR03862 family flavoprotein [Actinomycetota bacterium]